MEIRSTLRPTGLTYQGGAAVTITPTVEASGELFRSGTPDERLHRVENDQHVLRDRLDKLSPALRDEMRDEFNDEFGAADGGDNDVGLADSLTPFGGHTSIWVPGDQFGALTVLNDPITPDQSIGNDNTDSPPEPF